MAGPCCRCGAELLMAATTEGSAWRFDVLLVLVLVAISMLYVVLDRGLGGSHGAGA